MRNRILIVVIGVSLGLGARFGMDLYQRFADPKANLSNPPASATGSKPSENEAAPNSASSRPLPSPKKPG